MGFTQTTSLAILATFLLLSTAAPAAPRKTLASNLCQGAADEVLCTNMTKGAKDWSKAMTNIFNTFIKKAKAGKPIAKSVEDQLPDYLSPVVKKNIGLTCKEAYDTLIYNLKECKGFVKNDPDLRLSSYPSTLTFFDCRNALEEREIYLDEVYKFDDQMVAMQKNVLLVVKKDPKYVKSYNI